LPAARQPGAAAAVAGAGAAAGDGAASGGSTIGGLAAPANAQPSTDTSTRTTRLGTGFYKQRLGEARVSAGDAARRVHEQSQHYDAEDDLYGGEQR
jgi:hypothetical protein